MRGAVVAALQYFCCRRQTYGQIAALYYGSDVYNLWLRQEWLIYRFSKIWRPYEKPLCLPVIRISSKMSEEFCLNAWLLTYLRDLDTGIIAPMWISVASETNNRKQWKREVTGKKTIFVFSRNHFVMQQFASRQCLCESRCTRWVQQCRPNRANRNYWRREFVYLAKSIKHRFFSLLVEVIEYAAATASRGGNV